MSAATTIDDEAFAMATAPQNLFGFVMLEDAAKCVVAHIRRPIVALPWRDRAPSGKAAAAPRSRRHA